MEEFNLEKGDPIGSLVDEHQSNQVMTFVFDLMTLSAHILRDSCSVILLGDGFLVQHASYGGLVVQNNAWAEL